MEMSHTKEEVMQALTFLDNFSHDADYRDNLMTIYDYFNDLVTLTESYKEQATKSADMLLQMVGASANNRQGRRKLQKITSKL